MLHHTKAVLRAVKNAIVVADMPFESYQVNGKHALWTMPGNSSMPAARRSNWNGLRTAPGWRQPLPTPVSRSWVM